MLRTLEPRSYSMSFARTTPQGGIRGGAACVLV